MKTAALVLFILMYVLMIAVPKYRPYYALTAAVIFLATGILPPASLITAINWNVLLMIAGTMIIVYYFIDSNMPVLLADILLSSSGVPFLFLLSLITYHMWLLCCRYWQR